MGNFKDLNVWKSSKDLAVEIYRLTEKGRFCQDFGLRDQMRRSSVSIPSNIAEGDDLESDKQSIKYFYIARGSLAELGTQILISAEIDYIQKEKFDELEKKCEKISAMIMGLIKHRSK